MTPENNALPMLTREPNDAIAFATDTRINAANPKFTVKASIDYDDANRYPTDDSFQLIDATEDVDLYKVELKAGDKIKVDIDSRQLAIAGELPIAIDSKLRIFDAAGAELALSDDTPAPDEIFLSEYDSYLGFTAPADGAYYIGVSIFDNGSYNPLIPGSGSGSTSFSTGTFIPLTTGEYVLSIDLNSEEKTDGTLALLSTGMGPTVSLQSLVATYNDDLLTGNYGIIAPAAVETLETGSSALVLALKVEGEIPPGGLEVFVNSDSDLTELFATNPDSGNNLAYVPFSRGGQLLSPVFDQTGRATGFKFRMDQSNAVISLPIRDDGEVNQPKQVNFFVAPAAGYQVDPTAKKTAIAIYDTLDQVPAATVTPEVSFSVSKTTLVESAGDSTTFTFSLSEAPPPEGVLILVQAATPNPDVFFATFNAIGDFDIAKTQVTGGVFPIDNPASSGFYFKLTEQTASITLPVAKDRAIEGLEEVKFVVIPGAGYTVNADASEAILTFAETADSKLQVSYSIAPESLVEADATVSVHTFNLSATPPSDGVTVFVKTSRLGEFNLGGIETIGGSVTEVTETGFFFKITERNAVINLPVAADGEAEGLEEATFTLEAGESYQVSPVSNSGTFTIADTTDQLPLVEAEDNDTIPLAFVTGLSADRNRLSISGEIASHGEGTNAIDASEDVDFYAFNLNAGDTVRVGVNAIEYEISGQTVPQRLDSRLRLFNASGHELVNADNITPSPGSDNLDETLSFTATVAGTYYLGIGQTGNSSYPPFTAGIGSGRIAPASGINTGAYTLSLMLETTL